MKRITPQERAEQSLTALLERLEIIGRIGDMTEDECNERVDTVETLIGVFQKLAHNADQTEIFDLFARLANVADIRNAEEADAEEKAGR
jgi:hypothetical protein